MHDVMKRREQLKGSSWPKTPSNMNKSKLKQVKNTTEHIATEVRRGSTLPNCHHKQPRERITWKIIMPCVRWCHYNVASVQL